jgi:hypothetical protein
MAPAPLAPACATSAELRFSEWVDAPVVPFFLEGRTLLSNGDSVAAPNGEGFVQDGLLNWTSDCATHDVFTGFAGSWPSSAWTVRQGRAGTRLFRLENGRWHSSRLLAADRTWLGAWKNGAALLAIPRSHAGSSYELEALGAGAAALPRPAAGTAAGCATRLVAPLAFASTSSGEAAVVGRLCGQEGRFAVERFRAGEGASRLIEVPPGVVPTQLALGQSDALVLSGLRDGEPFAARLRESDWEELRDLPGTPVSLALGPNAELWVVTAVSSARCRAAAGGPPLSNLWRQGDAGWVNVTLPEAGQARFVAAPATDDVWVGMERGLLRSRPAAEPLSWSRAPLCPLPVTGAKSFSYRAASGGVRAEHPGRLVGSDCPHFLVVDETAAPSSTVFDAVLARLGQAPLFARGLQVARENYDRALSDRSAPFGSPSPWVSFENGRYYWGIWLDPVTDHTRVTEFLRREFPNVVRELCAAPFPIRLRSLTRTSASTAPR